MLAAVWPSSALLPILQQYFPEQLKDVTVESFYHGINQVAPSLIRTEADELTYHFHVMIRYELEKGLLENSLAASDIPAWWNEHYDKYLGVKVPDDKEGLPCRMYTGAMAVLVISPLIAWAASMQRSSMQRASNEIKGLDNQIQAGNTTPLLQWLRTGVHQYGRLYTSERA